MFKDGLKSKMGAVFENDLSLPICKSFIER
jgi:hypothetical protein